MKLRRPALIALALFVGLPALGAADAEAAFIRRSAIKTGTNNNGNSFRVVTTVSESDTVASVRAELESDAGDEDLTLVETDAWLHGAATIAALPAADAAVTVTLYDTTSAALISFSGTLGADGSVTLAADAGADCASRTGCAEEPTRGPDVELIAAELFTAAKGYDLGVDLAGADTYDVAYASITVTEGSAVCLTTDEKGNCLKWDTSKEVSTRSEVYWDDVGSVWEADAALVHEGLIELNVSTLDSRGKKIETAKSKLGEPWVDDGEGANSLATDEDPLTMVALHRGRLRPTSWHHIAVVSRGWTAGDDLPVDATVELTNGETITIPANSYQRKREPLEFMVEDFRYTVGHRRLAVTGDNNASAAVFEELSDADLGRPLCSDGYCVVLSEREEGGYSLSLSAYGADATDLPDEVAVVLTVTDESGDERTEEQVAELDDEITALFSNEVSFTGDPVGLGLSGKVSLLGEPNRKGKQETLAKGKFYAELSRDADGDMELGGGDKDEVVSSGNVVVSGAADALEVSSDDNGDGVISGPPVVELYAAGITVPRRTVYQLSVENSGKSVPIYR